MKQTNTSKLFFGKYAYKIVFLRTSHLGDQNYHLGWTLTNCKQYCDHNNMSYKVYSRVRWHGKNKKTVTTLASLFLEKKQDYDRCMSEWPDYIKEVVLPYSETHIDILKDNIKTVIREKLIYNKFRYVVTFRTFYNEPTDDLNDWVDSNIVSQASSERPVKWSRSGWNPKLYLTQEDDLTLTKLTWHDSIYNITIYRTYDELKI